MAKLQLAAIMHEHEHCCLSACCFPSRDHVAEGTVNVRNVIIGIADQICNIVEIESRFACSSVLLTMFYCIRHDFALTGQPLVLDHVGRVLSGTTNGGERGRRQTGSHKRRREEEDEEEAGMFLSSECA